MAKKTLTSSYNSLPRLARIIIQVLGGAIVGGIYRILRFLETKNIVTLVVGLIATFTGVGNVIFWIVDLLTLLLHGKYTILAD